jgi:hypothetical protein
VSGEIYGHSMLYPNIGLCHLMITTQKIVDIDQKDISSDPISHCTNSQYGTKHDFWSQIMSSHTSPILSDCNWYAECKSRSYPLRIIFRPYPAAMCLYDVFRYKEPKTSTLLRFAYKLFKKLWKYLRINATT